MTRETGKRKGIWIKPPEYRNIAGAQNEGWQKATPVSPDVGTDIQKSSQPYSYYIETTTDIGSNLPKRGPVSDESTPKTLAQKNKQKQNTDQIQNVSK